MTMAITKNITYKSHPVTKHEMLQSLGYRIQKKLHPLRPRHHCNAKATGPGPGVRLPFPPHHTRGRRNASGPGHVALCPGRYTVCAPPPPHLLTAAGRPRPETANARGAGRRAPGPATPTAAPREAWRPPRWCMHATCTLAAPHSNLLGRRRFIAHAGRKRLATVWVSKTTTRFLLDFTRFYSILLDHKIDDSILLDFTRFYSILLDFTRFYSTRFY